MLLQTNPTPVIKEILQESGNPALIQAQTLQEALVNQGFTVELVAQQLMEIAQNSKYSVRRQMLLDLMAIAGLDIRRPDTVVDNSNNVTVQFVMKDSSVQLNQLFNPERKLAKESVNK